MSAPGTGAPVLGAPRPPSPRQELWEVACALSPRHQGQLKLMAVQTLRQRASANSASAALAIGRRWWAFEIDYVHPAEFPAPAGRLGEICIGGVSGG